jgi:spore germination protein GerM
VLSANVVAGIATVDLTGPFDQLVGQAQIQAVAQFVFTATAQPGVRGVTFELDGQVVEVPIAGGAQVPIATRDQFASLAPAARPPA